MSSDAVATEAAVIHLRASVAEVRRLGRASHERLVGIALLAQQAGADDLAARIIGSFEPRAFDDLPYRVRIIAAGLLRRLDLGEHLASLKITPVQTPPSGVAFDFINGVIGDVVVAGIDGGDPRSLCSEPQVLSAISSFADVEDVGLYHGVAGLRRLFDLSNRWHVTWPDAGKDRHRHELEARSNIKIATALEQTVSVPTVGQPLGLCNGSSGLLGLDSRHVNRSVVTSVVERDLRAHGTWLEERPSLDAHSLCHGASGVLLAIACTRCKMDDRLQAGSDGLRITLARYLRQHPLRAGDDHRGGLLDSVLYGPTGIALALVASSRPEAAWWAPYVGLNDPKGASS